MVDSRYSKPRAFLGEFNGRKLPTSFASRKFGDSSSIESRDFTNDTARRRNHGVTSINHVNSDTQGSHTSNDPRMNASVLGRSSANSRIPPSFAPPAMWPTGMGSGLSLSERVQAFASRHARTTQAKIPETHSNTLQDTNIGPPRPSRLTTYVRTSVSSGPNHDVRRAVMKPVGVDQVGSSADSPIILDEDDDSSHACQHQLRKSNDGRNSRPLPSKQPIRDTSIKTYQGKAGQLPQDCMRRECIYTSEKHDQTTNSEWRGESSEDDDLEAIMRKKMFESRKSEQLTPDQKTRHLPMMLQTGGFIHGYRERQRTRYRTPDSSNDNEAGVKEEANSKLESLRSAPPTEHPNADNRIRDTSKKPRDAGLMSRKLNEVGLNSGSPALLGSTNDSFEFQDGSHCRDPQASTKAQSNAASRASTMLTTQESTACRDTSEIIPVGATNTASSTRSMYDEDLASIAKLREHNAFLRQRQQEKRARDDAAAIVRAEARAHMEQRRQVFQDLAEPDDLVTGSNAGIKNAVTEQDSLKQCRPLGLSIAQRQTRALGQQDIRPSGMSIISNEEAVELMSRANPRQRNRPLGLMGKVQHPGSDARKVGSLLPQSLQDANKGSSSASLRNDGPKAGASKKSSKFQPLEPDKVTNDDWLLFQLHNQGWKYKDIFRSWSKISSTPHTQDWFRQRYVRMRATYPELVPEGATVKGDVTNSNGRKRNEVIADQLKKGGSLAEIIATQEGDAIQTQNRLDALAHVPERPDKASRPTTGGKSISKDLAAYLEAISRRGDNDEDEDEDKDKAMVGDGHAGRIEASPPADDDKIHFAYKVMRRTVLETAEGIKDWFQCGQTYDNSIAANEAAHEEMLKERDSAPVWPLHEWGVKYERNTGCAAWTGSGIGGSVEVRVDRFERTLDDGVEPKSKQGWIQRQVFDVFEKRTIVVEVEDEIKMPNEELDTAVEATTSGMDDRGTEFYDRASQGTPNSADIDDLFAETSLDAAMASSSNGVESAEGGHHALSPHTLRRLNNKLQDSDPSCSASEALEATTNTPSSSTSMRRDLNRGAPLLDCKQNPRANRQRSRLGKQHRITRQYRSRRYKEIAISTLR